ncbi:S-adenosyl-L-methionine-dependent methyltransferase [Xylaria sp. FL0933]|nr:S-adenosyl-L-methionine-dependent methyltransferase [Xylaria sp. FL0933]
MALPDLSSVVAPNNVGAVSKLLSEVAAAGDVFSNTGGASLVPRRELLAKARELTHALETPREIMIQHIWAQAKHQPSNMMAISFGVQSGLWTAMANNGDGPQKVVDLSKQLGMQEELLKRIMRHIAASGYIDMTAPDEYTPNNFSKSLVLPVMSGSYYTAAPVLYPTFLSTYNWLQNSGYVCPTDNLDTPYQVAHDTKLHFFSHMQSNPIHGRNFSECMHGYSLGRPEWMDEAFYPVKERLVNGFDTSNKDAVLLIDIAGGFGHYTEAFLSKFPDAPGRLIVQDLPPVLKQNKQLNPRIEKMEYDFFTEQPVKGARTYYTHFVLHDWPDEEAIKIAMRVKEAMKPGYSKFLLHEHVVPPMNPDYEQTTLDLIMLTCLAGKERSLSQWSELLEKRCGLRIVKIWTPINGIESVIECELPE